MSRMGYREAVEAYEVVVPLGRVHGGWHSETVFATHGFVPDLGPSEAVEDQQEDRWACWTSYRRWCWAFWAGDGPQCMRKLRSNPARSPLRASDVDYLAPGAGVLEGYRTPCGFLGHVVELAVSSDARRGQCRKRRCQSQTYDRGRVLEPFPHTHLYSLAASPWWCLCRRY